MAVTPSEVYKSNVNELRLPCSEEGLSSEGPVRMMRPRLVRHLTGATMKSKQHAETTQASAQSDVSLDAIQSGPSESNFGSHAGGFSNVVPDIVELLRKVPTVNSDEPEAILRLVGKLDEINSLSFVDDKMFVIRILPLLSAPVLIFLENVCGIGGVGSSVNVSYCVNFSPISCVRG